MKSVSIYQIEESEILRKSYRLLAYFLANQQIARITDPVKLDAPLKSLEVRFLYQETSSLLLEVAILYRSLDDQLKSSANTAQHKKYLQKIEDTNTCYGFDMFDKLTIRDCCNKIIHATTFEPLVVEGRDAHTTDGAAFYGGDKREIVWHHLSGDVRISGIQKNELWAYLISVPEFVEALSFLLEDK